MANEVMSQNQVTDGDSWYGVQDPRKRKQIQDRLAQRARRKRLARLNGELEYPSAQTKQSKVLRGPCPTVVRFQFREDLTPDCGETLGWSNNSSCNETAESPSGSSESWPLNTSAKEEQTPPVFNELFVDIPTTGPSTPPLSSDQKAFPTPQLSVFAALWDNGAILGISCSSEFTWKSKLVPPDIPVGLHPTPLQQMKVHFTWIDRFPFPRMRDNMITLSGIFNEEDFLEDLFKQPSFTLKPGGLSWDPAVWKIAKGFSVKWGYLFY